MSLHSKEHTLLLQHFIKCDVKFLLIGGHAAIYYGVNRNTGDLDILVQPTRDNGARVISALKKMKLELPEIKSEEFERDMVLSFGLEPDAVDILNFTPGIKFDEAFANARIGEFEGMQVPIIDIRDLIRNKESLQRQGEKSLLDKYDVEVLKKILKRKGQ